MTSAPDSEWQPLDHTDALVGGALFVGFFALLLATASSVGYARDEGFYASAAQPIEAWISRLGSPDANSFDQRTLDQAFGAVHEHPALMKTLFAISHFYLHELRPTFLASGTAYRLPGMLMGSLAVTLVYLFGRQAAGRVAGLVAALAFAFLPRVFFHAHLACLDVPAACMWLLTSYAYTRAFVERRLGWALATAVFYGLFLDTKHNAWLLPFALFAHLAFVRGFERWRKFQRSGPFVPHALLLLLVLGPLVFFAVYPWIWSHTLERLGEWVRFHLEHDYYNMEFLGRTYWKPPMPRLYAWVMTIATVPAITLALFTLGVFDSVRHALRATGITRVSIDALWLISVLVSYAPWWSSETPIFGGTKHWITAYPFLCLLVGRGFVLAARELVGLGARLRFQPTLVTSLFVVICLLGPALMTLHAHPFGLSAYTPIVGGAPGAATLGLNRTFWGYTTASLAPALNARAPSGARVYVHDTALQSWQLLRADGSVRPDLNPTLALHASQAALYHHEPHMSRVEYQIWMDYGTVTPFTLAAFDGVPVAWAYLRPPRVLGQFPRRLPAEHPAVQ
jgi:4-amino-4-deoxy-L-arabinose transferase-like glycosyltransferase